MAYNAQQIQFLKTEQAQQWLREHHLALQQLSGLTLDSWMKEHLPQLTREEQRALYSQSLLRKKALNKWSDPPVCWIFEEDSLQQASHFLVSQKRAQILNERWDTNLPLYELGCAAGHDSYFLSRHFPLQSYEIDPLRASIASFNFRQFPSTHHRATLLAQDFFSSPKDHPYHLFADPARRDEKGRIFNPEKMIPPLSLVLQESSPQPHAGVAVKLHPGLQDRDIPPGYSVLFFAIDKDLKEALLLKNPTGQTQRESFFWSSQDQSWHHKVLFDPTPPEQAPLNQQPRYLFLPHPLVSRSRTLGDLSRQMKDAFCLDPQIGLLSCYQPQASRWGRWLKVLDSSKAKLKDLQKMLRSYPCQRLDLISKGVQAPLMKWQKKLSASTQKGDRVLTIVLVRQQPHYKAYLCQSIDLEENVYDTG